MPDNSFILLANIFISSSLFLIVPVTVTADSLVSPLNILSSLLTTWIIPV